MDHLALLVGGLLLLPQLSPSSVDSVGSLGRVDIVDIACAASDSRALATALREADGHRRAGREVHLQLEGRYILDIPLSFALAGAAAAPPGRMPRLVVRGPAVLDGGIRIGGWSRDATRPWLWVAPVPAALRAGGAVMQMFDGERRVPPARTPVLLPELWLQHLPWLGLLLVAALSSVLAVAPAQPPGL